MIIRSQLSFPAFALLAIPAFGQAEVREDTLDWRGYYPLEVGTTWEWHVDDYGGFQDLMHRRRIESVTLVDGDHWVLQTEYVEGTAYGEAVAEHDTVLLRYDEPFGRVLARSHATGEEYDYTCDLSGDFGSEVLCGADLGDPYPIVFDGGYAYDLGLDPLVVGSDTVTFPAIKYDPLVFGPVPDVYYHGVGPLQQAGDGFNGTIAFTYLHVGGIEYGSPASFVGTEQPVAPTEDGMVLYPNPVSNTLTVRSDNLSGPAILRIYDVTGRLALKSSHCTRRCRLDVRSLAVGVYMLDANFERGRRTMRHFVVSR